MKILSNTLIACLVISLAGCGQNSADSNGGASQNDSISITDNPPASRDINTVKDSDFDLEDSELKFSETETQMKLVLPNAAVFEEGSATFKEGSEATLQETLKIINERGIGKVLITGNTGRGGNSDENQKLSTSRAMAVAKWLKDRDLKKDVSLSAQGAGDRFPMISYELTDGSPNPQAGELNSRTEITFRKSRIATE